MTTPNDAAVLLTGVSKAFGARTILDSVDLRIDRGEFVALLGASGSGKTTLLRLLAGLDAPDAGDLLVAPSRTVVFQEPRLLPSQKVLRNVLLGLPRSDANLTRARATLEEVGLHDHEAAWPRTLSGGEAQRVALARALVREPQLLLLDEPFAALDALTRLRMHDLVGALCARHQPATLIVTHDVDEAIRLADRVIVLREGALILDEAVAIDRPRDVSTPAAAALRHRLLGELGVHGQVA